MAPVAQGVVGSTPDSWGPQAVHTLLALRVRKGELGENTRKGKCGWLLSCP